MNIPCPHCASSTTVKNGVSRHDRQRYRCRSYSSNFGERDHRLVDACLKEQALRHYAEEIRRRVTERRLGVRHNSVMNWVKQEIESKALAKIDASATSYVEASYMGEKGGVRK